MLLVGPMHSAGDFLRRVILRIEAIAGAMLQLPSQLLSLLRAQVPHGVRRRRVILIWREPGGRCPVVMKDLVVADLIVRAAFIPIDVITGAPPPCRFVIVILRSKQSAEQLIDHCCTPFDTLRSSLFSAGKGDLGRGLALR